MATVNQIKIVVEADDRASAPIERATEATKRLGRATRDITRESKKDWGGLADLFGNVLPRNLQMLQRGFKGTQRQVGRLSKSFKVLKTAWASVGIGLIIVAVEELVSNWDEWSERLGVSTKALKRQEEAQKRVVQEQTASTAELKRYQATVEDTTASEVDRDAALKALAKTLPQLEGLEAGSLETNEKIAQAMNDQLAIIKLREDAAQKFKDTEDAITAEKEKQMGLTLEQSILVSNSYSELAKLELRDAFLAENRIAKEAEWAAQKESALQAQRDTDSEINVIEKSIADQIEVQNKLRGEANEAEKELEKTAREAEAAKKRAVLEAEANAKWLAGQRIDLAQETELRLIEDEEKRELRSLEMQHEAAKAELDLREGTFMDKLALEQGYLMDRAEIEGEFQQQRDDKADEEGEKEAARVETLRSALATDQENDIMAVQQHYADLFALAETDSQEYIDLEKKQKDALEIVNENYAKKQREEDAKTQKLKMQSSIMTVNAARNALGTLGDMAEEGSNQAKGLAIVDIMLAQAVSVANAIAGATTAATATGPGALVATPLFIAQMVGTVLASFAGVKSILGKAGATAGGVGSGGGGSGRSGFAPITPEVPLPARLDTPDTQAYVVQSQLQGQMGAQARLNGQIVL